MTRSPKKGRPPKLTLADLRPAGLITCLLCGPGKPAEGAKMFHAHLVCAECQTKLPAKAGA
ncbi:hypothetical protein [Acidovorax phage ACPWH]|nr:hypothetical protein [Acidovorax phage ACPWH]QXV72252.1 hypothetical protein Acf1_00055 [Acidovorax phage ACF1]